MMCYERLHILQNYKSFGSNGPWVYPTYFHQAAISILQSLVPKSLDDPPKSDHCHAKMVPPSVQQTLVGSEFGIDISLRHHLHDITDLTVEQRGFLKLSRVNKTDCDVSNGSKMLRHQILRLLPRWGHNSALMNAWAIEVASIHWVKLKELHTIVAWHSLKWLALKSHKVFGDQLGFCNEIQRKWHVHWVYLKTDYN